VGGKVISLELQRTKTEYARTQLERAGLADYVEFRIGDALASLGTLPGPFDLVLIDLWKDLYVPVFKLLHPKLAQGQSSSPITCCSPRAPGRTRAPTGSTWLGPPT